VLLDALSPALERGFDYWERELFLPGGEPRPGPGRRFPLDAHDYAQAIETWLSAIRRRHDALERAERTADLLVTRMLNPAGYVDFQRGRFLTSRVPFVRWTTAPTFRALAGLELARSTR
jgi:polysaccharide biosynthesis protein VpsJ